MNALISTLPSSVTDTYMTKMGELKVFAKTIGTGVAVFIVEKTAATDTADLRIVGQAQFTNSDGTADNGKTMSLPTNSIQNYIYVKATDTFYLYFGNRKIYTRFTISTNTNSSWEFDLGDMDFTYCDNLKTIEAYRVKETNVNFAELMNCPIENLRASAPIGAFYGDIRYIAEHDNTLKNLDIRGNPDMPVYGSIDYFYNADKINTFYTINTELEGDVSSFSHSTSAVNIGLSNSNVSGTLESLFDGMYSNGRHSGSVTANIAKTNATYNGVTPTGNIVATFTNDGWTV